MECACDEKMEKFNDQIYNFFFVTKHCYKLYIYSKLDFWDKKKKRNVSQQVGEKRRRRLLISLTI